MLLIADTLSFPKVVSVENWSIIEETDHLRET